MSDRCNYLVADLIKFPGIKMFPARISFVVFLFFLYCVVGHPQGGLINSQVSDNMGIKMIQILIHNMPDLHRIR